MSWKLAALLLVVSAVVAMALWPDVLEVDVARVSRGTILVTIDEEGETRVRDRYIVAAPVAGRLQRIRLEPGDAVRRGQTVARLMPGAPTLLDARTRAELAAGVQAAQASLGQARAERERAAAALDRARSLVRRRQELAEAGIIARDQLEADEAALRAAEEELRASEYALARNEQELEMARVRLERPAPAGRTVDIVAPADGVVLKRFRESEADVPAGDPLIEVGNPADMEIVSDLLSSDAVRVSPGDRVLIEQWGGSNPIEARVRRVEPSGFVKISALGVEEQRVNVIMDFDTGNDAPTQLGDGYRVEVRVVVSEAVNVLTVPIGSLFRNGESWTVFLIEAGQARLRPVQIGQRNDIEAEVVGGLAEGQTVVLHPPDVLADGTRVTERPANGN
jgi:HlyD family secretion protein